jgi:hypothetical protein
VSNLFNHRVARRSVVIAAMAACAVSIVGGFTPARGGDIGEPIDLVAPPSYQPGQTIQLQLQTTGPSSVHIYSNPPGAASYDGTISSSSATVPVTVNPNVSGDVTLYFSTGGQQVVADSMAMATEIEETAEAPE